MRTYQETLAFLDETGLNYFKRKNDETYAFKAHTHNYAGSSSAGGPATSANKLNTNAGDATTPVYFSNGIPVACTPYSSASVNYSTTADKLGTSTVGGTTTPIYLNNGVPTALGYTIAKSVPSNAVFTDSDTKNTAGATNTTSKIYLQAQQLKALVRKLIQTQTYMRKMELFFHMALVKAILLYIQMVVCLIAPQIP